MHVSSLKADADKGKDGNWGDKSTCINYLKAILKKCIKPKLCSCKRRRKKKVNPGRKQQKSCRQ